MSAIAEAVTREVRIRAGPAVLAGTLAVPDASAGIVLFAHGSGNGRLSPRNAYVARQLQRVVEAQRDLFDLGWPLLRHLLPLSAYSRWSRLLATAR